MKILQEEIYPLFVKFLKQEGAYENYKKYVKFDPSTDIYGYRYDLICHFFNWKQTDEGWKYWSKINRKWNKLLSQKENGEH